MANFVMWFLFSPVQIFSQNDELCHVGPIHNVFKDGELCDKVTIQSELELFRRWRTLN